MALPKFAYLSGHAYLEIQEKLCPFESFTYVCTVQVCNPFSSIIAEIFSNKTFSTCNVVTLDRNTKYIYKYTDNGILISSLTSTHRTYKSE